MKGLVLTVLGIVMVLAALAAYGTVQVRATHDERNRALPGDNLIAQPVGMVNHAITIMCGPGSSRWALVALGGTLTT
jgi:hypothetical protein